MFKLFTSYIVIILKYSKIDLHVVEMSRYCILTVQDYNDASLTAADLTLELTKVTRVVTLLTQ